MVIRIHPADLYKTGDATQRILDSEDNTFQTQNCVKPRSHPMPRYEHEPDRSTAIPAIGGKPRQSKTYFISNGDLIKIGASKNVFSRVVNLQVASAHHLVLLAVTDIPENQLHHKFSHLHVRGEWFRATDELMAFIKTVRSGLTL